MDVTILTQLIGSLGFPIVACVGMAWYFMKQQQRNDATVAKLSDALNNNTVALTKLSEKLDKSGGT